MPGPGSALVDHRACADGGVLRRGPAIFVPDNRRSDVNQPCRYGHVINRTYLEFAQHSGAAVVPARAGHPRDKAVVEANVLVVQRWILAALRNRQFFSLAELNAAIWE